MARRGNVPRLLTTFVGREQELHDVLRLLRGARLLTLTGAGGVGKTRLALAVAAQLTPQDADETWFADLTPLQDPSLVPLTVAAAVGIAEERGTPILATLADHLQDRRVCLVLDGCDHLLAGCLSLVESLLRQCPDLRILATSREVLGIGGETVYRLPPLSLPGAEEPPTAARSARSQAVRLFLDRARNVLPAFQLGAENAAFVAQICRRLDGIPLALELAAARVHVLSLEQILERLDDRFRLLTTGDPTVHPRQRSLQATLDWSHHLLAEAEKVLFRRLAFFPGSFTLEAVESICAGDGFSREEVLDLLSRLVDKSLIMGHTGGSGARYSLLETMRAYGQAHLRRSGESDVLRHRHRSWFQHFAERGPGGNRTSWLDSLERELENFRGALMSSLEQNDVESAHRLAIALTPFWCARGHLTEGRHWLERIQARSSGLPEEMQAESLLHLGLEAAKQGEHGLAAALLEKSHDLFEERGDRNGMARATNALGINAIGWGLFKRAAGYFEECLAVARQLGDDARAAGTLTNLGLVALKERDEGRATSFLEQGLALARNQGSTPVVAAALTNLGGVALHRGDHARARAQLEEGLTFFVNDGMRGGVAECLEGLATVAAAEGQAKRAARLMGSADALREAMGITAEPGDSPFSEALTTMRQHALETPLAEDYLAGRAMPLEDAVASALARPLREAGPPITARMPSVVSDSQAALRVLGLGPIQVRRDGRVVVPSDWTYSKARELLVFLLNHSTRSKEQIGAALWPDISPTQLRDTFRVTLYHLRRTLGRADWILYTGDGYALNRSQDYWYDVDAFEDAAAEAARLKIRSPAQAMAVLQGALALYRGPFLEDLSDGQWYLLRREQLEMAFLEALLLFGQLAFDQGSYDRAAEAYRRAIRLDGYLEAAHRQLMRCYEALGERAQAVRHYEALVSRFRDELGISPDGETAALAARLRR